MAQTDSLLSTKNMSINVKYALFVAHDHNWYEVKAKHEYAFWVIQSGSMTIHYGETDYYLSAGDIFFFYPEILYHSSSSGGCSFTFIHFDAILGNNYQALHFFPFDGKCEPDTASAYYSTLLACAESMQKNDAFAELGIQGAVMLFLSELMKTNYQNKRDSKAVSHKNALARLQPAFIYINHHLGEPIYIKDLADTIHLSEKYFITFFKNTMGVTPANYITEVKMKKALEYLNEQRYSVKEVATMVGYADIYTFSKAFKKLYGVAPSKL